MDQQNQNLNPSDGDRSEPVKAGTGLSRRELLRGGAAVSPFLLTLASGPVAATTNCVVASSFVSAGVFVSRGGTNNIQCVPKTAKNWCDEAKGTSQSNCNWNPHNMPVSNYMTCSANQALCAGWTGSTACYHVFNNFGYGLHNQGDVAVLQRLLALSHGAPTVFTKDYCQQVWAARNNAALLGVLVNDTGNDWDAAQLLTWLDYSANGVTF